MRDRARDLESLIGIRRPGRPCKPAPEPGSVDAQLAEARLRRTLADADKIEQETARRRGELLEAAAVEKAWSAVLRDVRAAMLAIPGRMAAHLSKADSAHLDREIRAALKGLAE